MQRLALLGLLLVTIGVHLTGWDNGFAYDDIGMVPAYDADRGVEQEMIATLQPVSEYFTSHYLRGQEETSRGYRPLTVLSFAWTYHFLAKPQLPADWPASRAGLTPEQIAEMERVEARPHRAIQLLLQVLNTLLVFLVLARLCPGWPAVLGACVFGVHPLHTEPLANLVGRGELLGFGFGALALWLYLRANERAGHNRLLHLVGTSVALGGAFFAKENSVAWAAFLPVVRLVQSGERLQRDLLAALAVAVVPLALFFLGRGVALDGLPPTQAHYLTNPIHHAYADTGVRIGTALVVWAFAIYKLLWPFELSFDYGANTFALVESMADLRLWCCAILLLGLVVAGFRCRRREPLWFLAMACFFGFSLIVANVLFSQETIYGERNYYMPSLALSFGVAGLAARDWAKPLRVGLLAVLGVWLLAACVRDATRMPVWRDNDTLFLSDVAVQPRSLRALDNAASVLADRGDFPGYARYLERELVVEPDYPKALNKMAAQKIVAGDFAAARELLRRCQDSRLLSLVHPVQGRSRLHFNLGLLARAEGQPAQAAVEFERSVEVDPSFGSGYRYLTEALLELGKPGDALRAIEAWQSREPGRPLLGVYRGRALLRLDRPGEAERVLGESIPRLPPSERRFEIDLDLAEAIARQGRKAEARRILELMLKSLGGLERVPKPLRARVDAIRD